MTTDLSTQDGLGDELLAALGAQVESRRFRAGDMVIRQGQPTPLYIITSGRCQVFVSDKRGGEVVLGSIGPGMALGEMSNFMQRATNANVRAETDLEVRVIESADFRRIVERQPGVFYTLCVQLCQRLELTNHSLCRKVDDLLDLNERLETLVEERTAEIKRQNEELQRLMRVRDDFLNMAVHDLRAPLGNVLGFLEIMQEEPAVHEQVGLLDATRAIHRNCLGMLSLVNDVLDIAKIESGRLEIHLEAVAAARLVDDCLQANRYLAEGKGVHLAGEPAVDAGACRADPYRALEILNNLVSNAIKFSRRGDTVVIGARREEGMVRVFVRDRGPGIPLAEQPRLFGAFEQLSVKPTGGEKGTGLGLAIVKKLVKLHGGQVGVQSTPGQGATFHFTLPGA